MAITRRDALVISGSTLAALSVGTLTLGPLQAQAAGSAAGAVVARLAGGTAVARGFSRAASAQRRRLGARAPCQRGRAITDPLMWRTPNRQAPEIEYDFQKLKVKVDTRGLAKLAGTLRFADLEKLPRVSHTFLLQCGAPNPRGIVKWTGVRFSDFADLLGLVRPCTTAGSSPPTASTSTSRWRRCGIRR